MERKFYTGTRVPNFVDTTKGVVRIKDQLNQGVKCETHHKMVCIPVT